MFGSPEQNYAEIYLNDTTNGTTSYTLIQVATQTYFVMFDIDAAAKFSHVSLQPQNSVTKLKIETAGDFSIGPVGFGHKSQFYTVMPSTGEGAAAVIAPTVDTLLISNKLAIENSIVQNSSNVPVMIVKLQATANSVELQKKMADRHGTRT